MNHLSQPGSPDNKWLRILSKVACFATLFLIFAGGMVKSTESGLSVPDWPLSYGMFFPPMVGGVFYEHGHRMIATLVGLLILGLAIWLKLIEPRRWVRVLGYVALGAVIVQGVLGGITVLMFLPPPVSIAHGVLAQLLFVLTIIIAYSQTYERDAREYRHVEPTHLGFNRFLLGFMVVILLQLILGALVRHTGSGLAIPDFPKMAGAWWPSFDQSMLTVINDWRFEVDLPFVTMGQVHIHLAHRLMALVIIVMLGIINVVGIKFHFDDQRTMQALALLDAMVMLQIVLGILTVLLEKEALVTSFHVVTGAAVLGASTLLLLRAAPVSIKEF